MNTAEKTGQTRLLTPTELGACVRLFRETRKWSQEQLAEISGLNVRAIQRVERGLSASPDTCRALARAFEFDDLDALIKPFTIPSEEQLAAAKEKFDREHVALTAVPLTTGRQLARLAESCSADMAEPAFDLPRDAERPFAVLVDYFRDYRDCADVYNEVQRLEIYDELQALIDSLRHVGVSLRYAERKMQIKWGTGPDRKPHPINILYLVAFPLGKEPEQFSTPKSGGFRL